MQAIYLDVCLSVWVCMSSRYVQVCLSEYPIGAMFFPRSVCVCGIAYDSLTKHMTCLAVDLENVTL